MIIHPIGCIYTIFWFWWKHFGLNSYDNHGDEIVLYTDATDDGSTRWHNAHYLREGDCIEFGDDFPVLAVVGHEYGHSITAHRWPEDENWKAYENETGAINDSFADILSHFVDNTDWWMGEDLSLEAQQGLYPGQLRRELQRLHHHRPRPAQDRAGLLRDGE